MTVSALAMLSITACASSGLLSAEQLSKIAAQSSCNSPVLINHSVAPEILAKDLDAPYIIPARERVARVLGMGFKLNVEGSLRGKSDAEYEAISIPSCDDVSLFRYSLKGDDEAETVNLALYVKHSPVASFSQSEGVNCKPVYSQIYRPPTKLGGAGGLLSIRTGHECEPPPSPEQQNQHIRTVEFESFPPGRAVTLHEGNIFYPIGGCTTPCKMQIDRSKSWIVVGEMDDGHGEFLPLTFSSHGKEGMKLFFTTTPPFNIKLSTLAKFDSETAVSDEDAQALVRVPPVMPVEATQSGYCIIRFDVVPSGIPTNIHAESCSDPVFRNNSIKAVAKWGFGPKIVNGVKIGRQGVKTKVNYHLIKP